MDETVDTDAVLPLAARTSSVNGIAPKPKADIEVGVSSFYPFATPFKDAWEITRFDAVTTKQLQSMRRSDGQARALYNLIVLPIRAALKTATFKPAPNVDGGDKEAIFAEQMLYLPEHAGGMQTPFERVIAQLLMAVFDGFEAFELVYQTPKIGPLKGKWTLKKIAHRPAEQVTFLIDKKTNFQGLRQRLSHLGEYIDVKIDADNVLYYAAHEEERPFYGVSHFESAFYHYDKKVKIYFIAHIAAQRAAAGTRVGKVPAGASPAEVAKFKQGLAELGVAQYMTVPVDYVVESLKEGGTFDFLAYINHHNSQMSKSVLASFFDKDQGAGKGDQTLVDFGNQSDALFLLSLGTIMSEIEAVINNKLLPRFIDWNFGTEKYPQFHFGQLTAEQKEIIVEMFKTLAVVNPQMMAASPTFVRELEKKIADELGLEIDYETLEKQEEEDRKAAEELQQGQFGGPGLPGQPPPPGGPPGAPQGGPPRGGPPPAPPGGAQGTPPRDLPPVPPGFRLTPLDDPDVMRLAADLLTEAASTLMGGDEPLALSVRHIRTQEGAQFYGQPIGTVITRDLKEAAEKLRGKVAPDEDKITAKNAPELEKPAKVLSHPEHPQSHLHLYADGTGVLVSSGGYASERQHIDAEDWKRQGWDVTAAGGAETGKAPEKPDSAKPAAPKAEERKASVKPVAPKAGEKPKPTEPAKKPAPKKTPETHAPLTDEEYAEHTAKVEETIAKALQDGQDTETLYRDAKTGLWNADREKLHKEIEEELWAAAKNVPNDRKAIIAGGLGGAGKSTVLGKHANINTDDYLTINPDDVKELMAEKGMIPKVEGLSPMESAALIHEESSEISKELTKRALKEGKNLLFDITLASKGSAESRLAQMKKAGYDDPEGVFVDIPVETSVERALSRHRRGMEAHRLGEGGGGRFVPPALIRAQALKTGGSKNRANFDELKAQFSHWRMYDNSAAGKDPKLVGQSTGKEAPSGKGEAPMLDTGVSKPDEHKIGEIAWWTDRKGVVHQGKVVESTGKQWGMQDAETRIVSYVDHGQLRRTGGDGTTQAKTEKVVIRRPSKVKRGTAAQHKQLEARGGRAPVATGGTPEARKKLDDTMVKVTDGVSPEAIARLDELVIGDPLKVNDDGTRAYYSPAPSGGQSVLAVLPHTLTQSGEWDFSESRGNGWSTDSGNLTGIEHTMHHEFGHHLHGLLSTSQQQALLDDLGKLKGLKFNKVGNDEIPPAISDRIALVYDNRAIAGVGLYASDSVDEMIAELWAQHRGRGDKSSLAAKVVAKHFALAGLHKEKKNNDVGSSNKKEITGVASSLPAGSREPREEGGVGQGRQATASTGSKGSVAPDTGTSKVSYAVGDKVTVVGGKASGQSGVIHTAYIDGTFYVTDAEGKPLPELGGGSVRAQEMTKSGAAASSTPVAKKPEPKVKIVDSAVKPKAEKSALSVKDLILDGTPYSELAHHAVPSYDYRVKYKSSISDWAAPEGGDSDAPTLEKSKKLRAAGGEVPSDLKQWAKSMDEFANSAELGRDGYLYRGLHLDSEQMEQMVVGTHFVDHAHQSVSPDPKIAEYYALTRNATGAKNVMLKIAAPKGAKVGYVDESEMVLPRGKHFMIKSVSKRSVGGQEFVEVELTEVTGDAVPLDPVGEHVPRPRLTSSKSKGTVGAPLSKEAT